MSAYPSTCRYMAHYGDLSPHVGTCCVAAYDVDVALSAGESIRRLRIHIWRSSLFVCRFGNASKLSVLGIECRASKDVSGKGADSCRRATASIRCQWVDRWLQWPCGDGSVSIEIFGSIRSWLSAVFLDEIVFKATARCKSDNILAAI